MRLFTIPDSDVGSAERTSILGPPFDLDFASGGGGGGGGGATTVMTSDGLGLRPKPDGKPSMFTIYAREAPVADSTRRFAAIDARSGDTVIVAGVPSEKINVLTFTGVATAAVTARWKSGSTEVAGPFTLPRAGDWMFAPENSEGHFQTADGEPLVLNLSGGAVGGFLAYNLQ
jgi:hypothetical protein